MPGSDAPTQAGPYRLLEPLGRVGAVTTYKAVGPDRNRPVAVKLLSPRLPQDSAAFERFRRDAETLRQLHHPNLVQVLAVGQEGEWPYIAMEYLEGRPLDLVLKERRLRIPEACLVFRGICRGLAYAHQHGVVNRSLKPRDVLVSPDFSMVKLADFGLGRVESLGTTGTLNTGSIVLGALPYLAPEVVDSAATAEPDHRADLFGAGVIFHQMLTGRAPSGKFALPSQLNPELPAAADALVMKCLARNPMQRYATAFDLLEDLSRLEEALNLRVISEIRGITEAGSKLLGGSAAGGNRRWLIMAGILLLLAVLGAVAFFLLR
jgi:serine/threonine-protein kinase